MSIAHTCAPLHANWSWAERDPALAVLAQADPDAGWTRATRFPSEVHVELLAAGKIPDPYVEFGEHEVQCTCCGFHG
jgi:beta-mannosidase